MQSLLGNNGKWLSTQVAHLVLHSVVMSSNKAIQPLHREIQILTMSVCREIFTTHCETGGIHLIEIGSPPAGPGDLASLQDLHNKAGTHNVIKLCQLEGNE